MYIVYMYVCMYVCMYVHVYVCMYVCICMYVCMYVGLFVLPDHVGAKDVINSTTFRLEPSLGVQK